MANLQEKSRKRNILNYGIFYLGLFYLGLNTKQARINPGLQHACNKFAICQFAANRSKI